MYPEAACSRSWSTCHAMIDGVRALLPSSGGASLLADNILVIRLLCSDSFALRTALLPILTHLTHNAVPKNWRL